MTSPLVEYLVDELARLGHAQGRRMFSGHGLYLDGVIVGLVIDETLYLKVDAVNRPAFEAAGMEPFTYRNKGRRVALPYWQAPAEVVEEPEQLLSWVAAAAAASRRATGAGRKRKRGKRSSP
jgi:DNA transformation protein